MDIVKFLLNIQKLTTGLIKGAGVCNQNNIQEQPFCWWACVDTVPFHGNDCIFYCPPCLYKSIHTCWTKELIHKDAQSQTTVLPFAASKYEPGCFVSEDTYVNFWLILPHSYVQLRWYTDLKVMMLLLIIMFFYRAM